MKTAQWLATALVVAGAVGAHAQAPRDAASEASAATVIAWAPECAPHYAPAAQRAGAQGVTRMAVHLDEAGKVVAVDILQRSGDTHEHHLLDAEAARAIAQCPFTPARDPAGHPIASVLTLSQEWHVEGAQGDAKTP